MKHLIRSTVLVMVLLVTGCTHMEINPSHGPPATTVYVNANNMFGDPVEQTLKWDGHILRDPFPGSFVVPAISEGGAPGDHKVTLVDNLDASEALLMFPLFRARHCSTTFTVTEQ